MQPLVELKNISKTFPGVKALNNIQLKLYPGKVHALVGENGAGKSTLMKILCGAYIPDPGAIITIEGKKKIFKNTLEAMNSGISIIYQDISLFPNLSIAENIAFGNEKFYSGKVQWREIIENAKGALKKVGLENINVERKMEDFTIATQQLVAIARAVNFNSKVIIMDEPTATLSALEVDKLYKIVEDLKNRGIAIVFISHKFDEIYKVADTLTVLRDGEYVGTYAVEEITRENLIKKMVGRNVQYSDLRGKSEEIEGRDTILEIKNLTKKGNFKNINFNVKSGEILGITGLVGSGRTELIKSIFGLTGEYQGDVILEGKKVDIKTPKDAIKLGIGYVPEDRRTEGLILQESIKENLVLPILSRLKNKSKLIDENKINLLSTQKIKKLDIRPALPEQKSYNLSGGNQQKIVLGKWILSNPKLLMVDEPTNGVDIGAKTEIHKLLRELADSGLGVIVISSELPEILSVSDRVMVMRNGIIGGILKNSNLTQEELLKIAVKNSI